MKRIQLGLAVVLGIMLLFASPAESAALSKPVPTTVEIPLPNVRAASLDFEFHPSANRTVVRILGTGRSTLAEACAQAGGLLGSWGHFWTGCIPIPRGGALLPSDDGSMHVGVLVRVVSSTPSKNATIRIAYLPGDFYFSVATMTPIPRVATFTVSTASPVVLGAGVQARCSGTFTVATGKVVIVKKTLPVPSAGTWVNELPSASSLYTISLANPRCDQPGVDVGLATATGSPSGP